MKNSKFAKPSNHQNQPFINGNKNKNSRLNKKIKKNVKYKKEKKNENQHFPELLKKSQKPLRPISLNNKELFEIHKVEEKKKNIEQLINKENKANLSDAKQLQPIRLSLNINYEMNRKQMFERAYSKIIDLNFGNIITGISNDPNIIKNTERQFIDNLFISPNVI